jgi:hypothetical protein
MARKVIDILDFISDNCIEEVVEEKIMLSLN